MAKTTTQLEIHQNAVKHGWWDDQKVDYRFSDDLSPSKVETTVPEKLMLIVTETAEAMEEYRNPDVDIRKVYYEPGSAKPLGFPVELADAVIRAYDLAGALGFDLDDVIDLKHDYNKTRPHRHGGKKA